MVLSADDQFPLSFYYRIADQMMKQAKVYRSEGNAGDLYLALNRYARLVSEVIPKHRSYSKYSSKQKVHHEKILNDCVKEIARLKPLFGQTPRKGEQQEEGFHSVSQILNEKGQAFVNYTKDKVNCGSTVRTEGCKYLIPRTEGCNTKSCTTKENDKLLSGAMVGGRTIYTPSQAHFPVALTETRDRDITMKVVTHFFPPDLSYTESLPLVGNISHVTVPESENEYVESSSGNASASNAIQDVHISARLMEEFMELARVNTDKSIETCGILGAFLKDRTFYVTTLIIPKQESSSNSCQALNEEDIYKIQDEQSLFPVGWIHTHPSQTCFLSSIDLHTQYSYQVMLPEAVAIVMAPTDPTRSFGLFRLTDPGGMAVLRQCQEKGFHQHLKTADGSPIYESCSNVYVNPNLRFEIIDLRYSSR